MHIHVKRVYESAQSSDGKRILIDRLWPRGLSKEKAHVDHWIREIAPSDALRKWFGHDPERWPSFRERYFRELDAAPEALAELRQIMGSGRATLLYAAKDELHNNAVALRSYLEKEGT